MNHIENNIKNTPPKRNNISPDPPLPLTSSDEEDNNNRNVPINNTPSPSIDSHSSHVNYTTTIPYTFDSKIHSLSYSIHQYSTTNTNTYINTQNKNNLYDLSFNESNIIITDNNNKIDSPINDNNYNKLIQIDETTERSSSKSKASTSLLNNNNKHSKIANYTISNDFSDGKGYKSVTWRDWETLSQNKFICNGLIMFGSNFKYFILTNILIFIPSVLQSIFLLNSNSFENIYIKLLNYILFILCIILLYISSFTDPGYLPRGYEIIPPINKQLKSNGSKFCITCRIWRPPRAKHCRYCNCCVRKFDHHCHFIGTCVGQRNEHWFSLFLFVICLYSFYSIIISLHILIIKFKQHFIIWDIIKYKPYAFCIFLYSLIIFVWVITLLKYRCMLICNHETQNENLKKTFKKNGNPYDKGWINNCKNVYCEKKPISQIK